MKPLGVVSIPYNGTWEAHVHGWCMLRSNLGLRNSSRAVTSQAPHASPPPPLPSAGSTLYIRDEPCDTTSCLAPASGLDDCEARCSCQWQQAACQCIGLPGEDEPSIHSPRITRLATRIRCGQDEGRYAAFSCTRAWGRGWSVVWRTTTGVWTHACRRACWPLLPTK